MHTLARPRDATPTRSPGNANPARGLPRCTTGLLLLGALAGCGGTTDPDPRAPFADPATAQSGELLLASAPAGWVRVSGLNEGDLRIAEYADPSTLAADQVDSVRFESQTGDPLPDPIDFLLGMHAELTKQCQGTRDFPIFSGFENGYPTSVRLMLCRQKGDPPRGEVRMVKAIQGTEQFYIVSRSRSTAPFRPEQEPMTVEDMAAWSAWIGAIRVCDTRSAEHPCVGAP